MSRKILISTPRGEIIKSPHGKAELVWNEGFGKEKTATFNRAQAYVDSEVLRFCSARVPFQTGFLQKSGILGTVIGSGEIIYIAPYARHQYYETARSRGYDPNRGAYWFERGKIDEKDRIFRVVASVMKGG